MPKKQPLYPHVPKSKRQVLPPTVTGPSSLKEWAKGKLGAFICGQCGQRFHSMEELNKHLARYHPEANSSITRLAMTSTERSFPLGRLMMTRGVNDLVADNKEFALFVLNSLQRHVRGDWGDLSEEDKKENEYSLNLQVKRLPQTEPLYVSKLGKVKDRLEELRRTDPDEFYHRKNLFEQAVKEREKGYQRPMPELTIEELRDLLKFTNRLYG